MIGGDNTKTPTIGARLDECLLDMGVELYLDAKTCLKAHAAAEADAERAVQEEAKEAVNAALAEVQLRRQQKEAVLAKVTAFNEEVDAVLAGVEAFVERVNAELIEQYPWSKTANLHANERAVAAPRRRQPRRTPRQLPQRQDTGAERHGTGT